MLSGVQEKQYFSMSPSTKSELSPIGNIEPGGGMARRSASCVAEIQRLERNRTDRRKLMEKTRANRATEEARNVASGNPGDLDFMGMIRSFRDKRMRTAMEHMPSEDMKICVAVRKRPTNTKERARKDHDAVSCFNPEVTVHDCKLRVDGISKYLDNSCFRFDQAFGEEASTEEVYRCTVRPLVSFVLNKGRASVFAYGQTGSGKTYTMVGIQRNATSDLFELLAEMPAGDSLEVLVSFFEIYGGRCQDLLNRRKKLVVREDGKGEVVVAGLEEKLATDAENLEALIADGNRNRTTHATDSNDESSRSHAICQISVREKATGRLYGKLSLIDLAGSERGADTKSHNRQRRMEGAAINTSLLALKECIRALGNDSVHVPYRSTQLTLVLKDSFTRKNARTVMIATVSPAASSADHTINTLRYADRVKEKKAGSPKQRVKRRSGGSMGGGKSVLSLAKSSLCSLANGTMSGIRRASPAGGGAARARQERAAMTPGPRSKQHAERRSGSGCDWGAEARGLRHRRSVTDFATAPRVADETPELDRQVMPTESKSGRRGDGGGGAGLLRRKSLPLKHPWNLAGLEATSKSAGRRRTTTPRTKSGLDFPLEGGLGLERTRQSASMRDLRDFDACRAFSSVPGVRVCVQGDGALKVVDSDGVQDWAIGGPGLEAGCSPEKVGIHAMSPPSDLCGTRGSDWRNGPEEVEDTGETVREGEAEFIQTVQSIYEEEDALLKLHVNVLTENARLLTEEGMLLRKIQGDTVDENDLDAYANRLGEILERKMGIMSSLRTRLHDFRDLLRAEESASLRLRGLETVNR